MAASSPKKEKMVRIGFQHVIIALSLVVGLFWVFQQYLIPKVASAFVLPLFQPSLEEQEKIGFVKFENDGLVWASLPKDKAEEIASKRDDDGRAIATAEHVGPDYINKEYIFDFTWDERKTKEHGYAKAAAEYYVRAPILGEHAIILEPWIGFIWIAFVLSAVVMLFVTMILPISLGFMAVLFDRQIDNTKAKIRLQTGFNDDIVDLLIMPDHKLANMDNDEVEPIFRIIWNRTVPDEMGSAKQMLRFDDVFHENVDIVDFRRESLYARIKEFFSDFVLKEIEDTKDGLKWRKNHFLFFLGLRLYMAHHFTEKYANNVTGLAYGGAAFLIIAIGIRGLKFIPAARPSFILLAIFLEFSMLSLLAVTLVYTEEEERMDKMLKKMEDANRSQLETLRGQQHDIHQLSNALVGQTAEIIKNRVENAIEEYMTSDNNIEREIANQIAEKVMYSMRESSKKPGLRP